MKCAYCSVVELQGKQSKFCSNACKAKFFDRGRIRIAKHPKNCVKCNSFFLSRRTSAKFCSKKCFDESKRKFLDIPSCLLNPLRKLDKTLGYVRVYCPMHKEANSWGYVYEHRVIAEEMMGRPLVENEIVHHRNGKRWDNRKDNLKVMIKNDHAKLPRGEYEDTGIENVWDCSSGSESANLINWRSRVQVLASPTRSIKCKGCGAGFKRKWIRLYCDLCRENGKNKRKVERPSRDVLLLEIRSHTWRDLGKKYGVTDNAVKKWAKAYGIEFDVREYVRKDESMNFKQLSSKIKEPDFHKQVLHGYDGAYSIGITNNPPHGGLSIRLRIEGDDVSRFPQEVLVDGDMVPLIVSTDYKAPFKLPLIINQDPAADV